MDVTSNITSVSPTGGGSIIWAYILIVAAIALIPHIVDIFKAYNAKNKLRVKILELPPEKINSEEFKELVKEASEPPHGISGLSRGTMALAAIVILGIALFHLLITRTSEDSTAITNVLSMLGSLIAAIVGFYFGGKAATEAGKTKQSNGGRDGDGS